MITSLVIYHLLAYRQWKKHRESLQHYFADARSLQLNWVRQFVIISFFTGVIIVTSLYLLYINYPFGHEYRYGFLVITLVIYWFSYTALTKPAVFSTIKGHAEVDDKNPSRITPLKVYHSVTRYANSKLEEEEVGEIQNGLKMIMENKIFLEPELTINGLAQKLNCSRHHLSQVLNEHLKQSYYDYINNFRVNEVMILLRDPARQHQKIASIAYDAGFNSLSTFNEVFKKTTGQTPSQFRKQADDAAQQQRV